MTGITLVWIAVAVCFVLITKGKLGNRILAALFWTGYVLLFVVDGGIGEANKRIAEWDKEKDEHFTGRSRKEEK